MKHSTFKLSFQLKKLGYRVLNRMMNHKSVRIHGVNVKGYRVLGVTMATKTHTKKMYESANIGINNYYNNM